MMTRDEWDLAEREVKEALETKPRLCKQCEYEIVEGGRLADQEAQKKGFCGSGCLQVWEAINEYRA